MYFEQANMYYKKYCSDMDEDLLNLKDKNSLNDQKEIFLDYIKNIKSGAIVLCEDSFKAGRLISEEIISKGTGFTNDIKKYSFGNIENVIERFKIVLSNYESTLSSIQTSDKPTKMEAICIANIIKLNEILGDLNNKSKFLFNLAERCLFIIDNIEIDKKEEWYKDFIRLYEKLKQMQPSEEDYNKKFKKIKELHRDIFKEIENKFNSKKNESDFINFILERHPYKNYKNDKQKKDFSTYNQELIRFLLDQYHPDNYTPVINDKEAQLQFFIFNEISKRLNNIYHNIQ
jgi:hypothetical protein